MNRRQKTLHKIRRKQCLDERMNNPFSTVTETRSYAEYYSGVTHKIIILSDAHTSVTNLLRDKNGRNFVIIHMESENGNVYRDLIYPSMRVLNSRGGNNEAMAYMEKTLKTVQNLIFDVVKRKEKEQLASSKFNTRL